VKKCTAPATQPNKKARLGSAGVAQSNIAGAIQAANSHCNGANAQNQTKPATIALIQSRLPSTELSVPEVYSKASAPCSLKILFCPLV
jgi:hypothetical protein